jgi:hypothetical protein
MFRRSQGKARCLLDHLKHTSLLHVEANQYAGLPETVTVIRLSTIILVYLLHFPERICLLVVLFVRINQHAAMQGPVSMILSSFTTGAFQSERNNIYAMSGVRNVLKQKPSIYQADNCQSHQLCSQYLQPNQHPARHQSHHHHQVTALPTQRLSVLTISTSNTRASAISVFPQIRISRWDAITVSPSLESGRRTRRGSLQSSLA